MYLKFPGFITTVIVFCLFSTLAVLGNQTDDKKYEEAVRYSETATDTLKEYLDISKGYSIPPEILRKASAIAVFPHVRKFDWYFFSNTKGRGLVSVRTQFGWSAGAFYKFNKNRFDFGFGIKNSEFILVFMDNKSIDGLFKGNLRLGKDAPVVFGELKNNQPSKPVLEEGVLIYTKDKMSVTSDFYPKGFEISPDNELNNIFFGKNFDQWQILAFNAEKALQIASGNKTQSEFSKKLFEASPGGDEKPVHQAKVWVVYVNDSKNAPKFVLEFCPLVNCPLMTDDNGNFIETTKGWSKTTVPLEKDEQGRYYSTIKSPDIDQEKYHFKWVDSKNNIQHIPKPCNKPCELVCNF